MLRRSALRLYLDNLNYHRNGSQKLVWTPEIRMLDKDEKLPEVDSDTKLSFNARAYTFSPERVWPPMDPLRPTKEQKRIANTSNVAYPSSHRWVPPYKMGFRTVPPELVDWRSSFYGDPFEELPYANEKLYFAHPDYSLAGLLYSGKECKAIEDTCPRNVEESSLTLRMSPKVDAFMRWQASRFVRNARVTGSKWATLLIGFGIGYLINKFIWRQTEFTVRRMRGFWDGAYAGTWKYGSMRSVRPFRFLTGGNFFYIV